MFFENPASQVVRDDVADVIGSLVPSREQRAGERAGGCGHARVPLAQTAHSLSIAQTFSRPGRAGAARVCPAPSSEDTRPADDRQKTAAEPTAQPAEQEDPSAGSHVSPGQERPSRRQECSSELAADLLS